MLPVFWGKSFWKSYLTGGFIFINISMAFSSSGSTTTSVSHSAASAVPAAPSEGHSSSESASSPPGPTVRYKSIQDTIHIHTVNWLQPLGTSTIYSINHCPVVVYLDITVSQVNTQYYIIKCITLPRTVTGVFFFSGARPYSVWSSSCWIRACCKIFRERRSSTYASSASPRVSRLFTRPRFRTESACRIWSARDMDTLFSPPPPFDFLTFGITASWQKGCLIDKSFLITRISRDCKQSLGQHVPPTKSRGSDVFTVTWFLKRTIE